jgi:predicted lactoylglutathione lyase
MLLKEEFFKTVTKKEEISDANRYTEVLIALHLDSKEQVDETVKKAVDSVSEKISFAILS